MGEMRLLASWVTVSGRLMFELKYKILPVLLVTQITKRFLGKYIMVWIFYPREKLPTSVRFAKAK
jgi:hypothetical protein